MPNELEQYNHQLRRERMQEIIDELATMIEFLAHVKTRDDVGSFYMHIDDLGDRMKQRAKEFLGE